MRLTRLVWTVLAGLAFLPVIWFLGNVLGFFLIWWWLVAPQ